MVPLTARCRPVRSALDGMLGAVTTYFNFERADRVAIERSSRALEDRQNDRKGRSWVAGAASGSAPCRPATNVGPSGTLRSTRSSSGCSSLSTPSGESPTGARCCSSSDLTTRPRRPSTVSSRSIATSSTSASSCWSRSVRKTCNSGRPPLSGCANCARRWTAKSSK